MFKVYASIVLKYRTKRTFENHFSAFLLGREAEKHDCRRSVFLPKCEGKKRKRFSFRSLSRLSTGDERRTAFLIGGGGSLRSWNREDRSESEAVPFSSTRASNTKRILLIFWPLSCLRTEWRTNGISKIAFFTDFVRHRTVRIALNLKSIIFFSR